MTQTLTPEEAGRSLVQNGTPERRQATLDEIEVRAADDGKLSFVGHAAVFDRMSEDLGGFTERIQRGAFRKVLDTNPDVRFLFNHNPDLVLARSTVTDGPGMLELREDPKGLRVYAELVPTSLAADLRALVKSGVVSQMSFGFRIGDDGKDVWGEEDGQLVRTIVSFGQIYDVSPVVFPAYRHTDASMRSLACGLELVNDQGDVRRSQVSDLAWKIHRGEQEATVEERAAIDAAFARIDTVSPWMAERAFRAASQEPELQAAIPGKRATVTLEDADSGGQDAVAFRLAARKRRLRAIGATPIPVKETAA